MAAVLLDLIAVPPPHPLQCAFTGSAALDVDAGTKDFRPDFWGEGYIANYVKVRPQGAPADGSQDVPAWRKVRLMRDMDDLCIRETWSDKATGAYRFDNIPREYTYTALSRDHTDEHQAVAADRLVPVGY